MKKQVYNAPELEWTLLMVEQGFSLSNDGLMDDDSSIENGEWDY